MKLLEDVSMTEQQVWQATQETATLRNEVSGVDAQNLNLRKELEMMEAQVAGGKDACHEQYTELARLRDISYGIDKDLDA